MFGGFTQQSWSTTVDYKRSEKAFLFQLRPTLKRYSNINGGDAAIQCHGNFGPIFGFAQELIIYPESMDDANSYTEAKGEVYDLPTDELNGGEKYFRVKDYVVLRATNL